ncbi:TetR/AcrR family transcriptional regulator [Leucobacter denitrificans]|uniref:TetR/AcrR family transcriptional regulator n=1 Tax=Leucobacter denitrificans TaxID=683042 RepID=A0A7G9S550_9MICO|nr:TetR family transcriptional regulator [Leucobacter denitrificans]QNN62975.1 TetR/AcrR family transcriptional regulator [Leucobacter denitrificans]
MTSNATRKRRERGSISPEDILAGAFIVAERDGLDNLSMPVLASHLEIGVTSIYWYFRSKDDLLRKMTTQATTFLQNQLPTTEGWKPEDWQEFLLSYFSADRASHQNANVLTDLVLMRTSSYSIPSTHRVYRGIESILAYLTKAGFTARQAWFLYSSLSLYTRGFIITERMRQVNQTPPVGLSQLSLIDVENMPILVGLISEHDAMLDMADDESFAFGVRLALEQAARILEETSG